MTDNIFTIERFTHLLDRYGADIALWPAAIRATAGTWLVTQPEAQHLLKQAEQQQQALHALLAPLPMDSAAQGRLMAGLARRRYEANRTAALFSPRLAFASFAMACVLFTGGIWTGDRLTQTEPQSGYTLAYNTANDDLDPDQDAYLDALITGEIL